MSHTEYIFNIITIGESAVGKSCIMNKYVKGECSQNQLPTIGIDFKTKKLIIDDQFIKLKICDTAGQERFRNITKQYYKNAQGILLVYDITNRASFDHVEYWITQLRNNASEKDMSIAMIANKIDMENERCVSKEEGSIKAKDLGAMFYETSAWEGIGIEEVFDELVKEMIKKKREAIRTNQIVGERDGIGNIAINSKEDWNKNNQGWCC